MSAAQHAPAIGYSIIANLGDDRQMTVQCFVAEDEPLGVIAAKVDKVLAVVDRQKARYSIRDLQKELVTHEQKLAQFEEDFAKVEAEHIKAQEALREQAQGFHGEREDLTAAAYAKGRQKPVGAEAARYNTLGQALKEIDERLKKNDAERDQHHANLLISIDRFRKAIVDLNGQIAEQQALINGA